MQITPFKATLPQGTALKKVFEGANGFLNVLYGGNPASQQNFKNDAERYAFVRNNYLKNVDAQLFKKENQAAFYIYQKTDSISTYKGIIATVAAEDYVLGKIKQHEAVFENRVDLFSNYLSYLKIHSEPVMMGHAKNETIACIMNQKMQDPPKIDYQTTTTRHQLWCIDDASDIKSIVKAFEHTEQCYILDGHHRSASSVRFAQQHLSAEEKPRFMSFFLTEEQVRILPLHRLIKSPQKTTADAFLEALEADFIIEKQAHTDQHTAPTTAEIIKCYLQGAWYDLQLKNPINDSCPVAKLSYRVLSKKILNPILGMTDQHFNHIGFTSDVHQLVEKVNGGAYDMGFALCAVDVKELEAVADAGLYMPPKSTWILPKMVNGLTIFEF